ncbi:MAG: hypothetical protein OXH57_12725 [Ekhidna sp.]|nr:hypothetical protein [Ekhidna sp.]
MSKIRFEYRGGTDFKEAPFWILSLNGVVIARSIDYDTEQQCSNAIDRVFNAIKKHKNPDEIKVVKNKHYHNVNLENP